MRRQRKGLVIRATVVLFYLLIHYMNLDPELGVFDFVVIKQGPNKQFLEYVLSNTDWLIFFFGGLAIPLNLFHLNLVSYSSFEEIRKSTKWERYWKTLGSMYLYSFVYTLVYLIAEYQVHHVASFSVYVVSASLFASMSMCLLLSLLLDIAFDNPWSIFIPYGCVLLALNNQGGLLFPQQVANSLQNGWVIVGDLLVQGVLLACGWLAFIKLERIN